MDKKVINEYRRNCKEALVPRVQAVGAVQTVRIHGEYHSRKSKTTFIYFRKIETTYIAVSMKHRTHSGVLGGEGSLKMNLCQIRLWHFRIFFSEVSKEGGKTHHTCFRPTTHVTKSTISALAHNFSTDYTFFSSGIFPSFYRCSLNHLIRVLSHVMTLIMVLNILSCIYFNEEHLMCLLLSFQQCYNWENCCL